MNKEVSQESLLTKPQPLAFLKVISNTSWGKQVYPFPTKCCLSLQTLQYPVINTNCYFFCYMSMQAFLQKFENQTCYICPKCQQKRLSENVVYDIGYQSLIHRTQFRKRYSNHVESDYIFIDKNGVFHENLDLFNNESMSTMISTKRQQKINTFRKLQQQQKDLTITIDTQKIRSQMQSFYQKNISMIRFKDNFLFCRGYKTEDQKGYTSIYFYNNGYPFHFEFYHKGQRVRIQNQSQIHFIGEGQAFYIVANQNNLIKVFKGSITKMFGNKLQLEQINLDIKGRRYFSVTHNKKDRLYIIGGLEANKPVKSVLCINLKSNKLDNIIKPMNNQRVGFKACYYNQKLYVVGGSSRLNESTLKAHEYYDFKKQKWLPFQTQFSGLNFGVFVNKNGIMTVYGGWQDWNITKQNNKYYNIDLETNKQIFNSIISRKQQFQFQFQHENPNRNQHILRVSKKLQNRVHLITFLKQGVKIKTLRIMI